MRTAQIAFATLTAVCLICGVVLLVHGNSVAGSVTLAFGLFGYLMLVGMILNDARPAPAPDV